jgi:16S rRNA (guanine527-N7)-methyltransferase
VDIINKYFDEFTTKQQEQFAKMGNAYASWNDKINVISRKDIDSIYERHILHSLSLATQFDFAPGSRIIDLGCGGGFPGVPLAVFFPEVEFILIDSINKKLNVINAICEELNIQNVRTIHSRIEDIKDLKVDYVVSRAVAQLLKLWTWSKPLLKKNAGNTNNPSQRHSLICLKGGDLSQEISSSGVQPNIWELSAVFEEEFFKEKYILQVVA